jgi:hypothetical protein
MSGELLEFEDKTGIALNQNDNVVVLMGTGRQI